MLLVQTKVMKPHPLTFQQKRAQGRYLSTPFRLAFCARLQPCNVPRFINTLFSKALAVLCKGLQGSTLSKVAKAQKAFGSKHVTKIKGNRPPFLTPVSTKNEAKRQNFWPTAISIYQKWSLRAISTWFLPEIFRNFRNPCKSGDARCEGRPFWPFKLFTTEMPLPPFMKGPLQSCVW